MLSENGLLSFDPDLSKQICPFERVERNLQEVKIDGSKDKKNTCMLVAVISQSAGAKNMNGLNFFGAFGSSRIKFSLN